MAALLLKIGLGAIAIGAVMYSVYVAEEKKKRIRDEKEPVAVTGHAVSHERGIDDASVLGASAASASVHHESMVAERRNPRRRGRELAGSAGIFLLRHALDQMEHRAVSEADILAAIEHGSELPGGRDGCSKLTHGRVTVVYNRSKRQVITVYPAGEACIIM